VTSRHVFAPEVHAFFIAPLLDEMVEQKGHAALQALLASHGVTEAELRDRAAWLSLRFCEAFLRDVYDRLEDPLLSARIGRAAFSAKYMGPLRMVVRAFGDPTSGYLQMARGLERFNKVGAIEVVERGRNRFVFAYRPLPGAPREEEPLVCDGRRANMEALPTLFDLPPARVEHPKCIHRGDDACEYHIRFTAPGPRTASRLAVLLGGGIGAAISVAASWPLGTTLAVATASSLGLWALVRQHELRRRISNLAGTVVEQQDALIRSTTLNEERFTELVDAKTHVEQRVVERTRELEEASQQLEAALTELQTQSEAKTEFFANVSHELRTPLTLVLSPLEALRSKATPYDDTLATIENNARRLLRLINQLLDLAKADAGEARLAQEPIDLGRLATQVVDGFRTAAETEGIDLRVDVPEDLVVALDPKWIDAALSNLLANALRYARTRIEVAIEDTGGELLFRVDDDGPGVPESERDTIFDRFAQVDGERRGTGLGLAIVREAARLHGGSAAVTDSNAGGARFELRVPRRVTSGAPVEVETKRPSIDPRPAPAVDRDGPHPGAPLALVAEDHAELREFVTDVLASRFRVATAANGRAALDRIVELQPDVIVADVAMPEMDGLALCRAVRSHERTSDTPILLVTARGEPQQVLEGFDAGADDYLVKPFHGRELLARIDAQLRLRAMLHRLAHQERLASLGVLAASVAHQVRNPLTALVSGLPAVRRKIGDDVSERTREMLDVFVDCALRIERITVDLLDLSRIDRESEGELAPGAGLMAAVRLTAARLPEDVDLDTDVDVDTRIRGRAGDLNHVFLNLLDNASRAIGDRGRIAIRGAREDDAYRITIEDSGPGVPDELTERIFEPFVSYREGNGGTGLGLAIVRDIVEAHRGRIQLGASSRLGGARFVVELPVPRAEPAAAE